nr:hypothetical protein [Armatimonadota bacterium]
MTDVFRCAIVCVGLLCALILPAGADGDKISYLDNAHIRLGVELDLGGAITYLSKSGSEVNVVNSFDWGRQIQLSFYSGPNPFAPHGKTPNKAWAGLGWNPIQSGDSYGHRSTVLESRNNGKEIYVKSIPMQWPLDNEPGECTFETWIRLDGNAAHVRSRLINHREDTTQYPGRGQELPAIYTNGPWHRLMTYMGDKPFTGETPIQIPQKPAGSSFPWTGWQATENWAALVNDDHWGLGVWEPGAYSFLGGFAGAPGKGGPKDGPTGYIAPLQNEILDHNIQYEFQYDLILGTLDEIRKYVYSHAPKPSLPSFRFDKDRQHWRYENATDDGWPVKKELRVRLEANDPKLLGPAGFWQAQDAPKLTLEAAFHTGGKTATVFWTRADESNFSEDKSVTFDVISDGKFHRYEVNLAASPEYRGAVTGLRLDPEPTGRVGD